MVVCPYGIATRHAAPNAAQGETMTKFLRVAVASGASLALVLLLTGCGNLAAIREFGGSAARLSAYPGLIEDYAAMPKRMALIEQVRNRQGDGSNLKAAEIRQGQVAALVEIQTAIARYMAGLAALASDDVIPKGKSIDDVFKAIPPAAGLSADTSSALSSVVGLLVRAATETWRRAQLARIIGEAEEPLQSLLKAQRTFVEKAYLEDLLTEQQAVGNGYNRAIRDSSDMAGRQSLREWRYARLAEIDRKKKAIDAYQEANSKIAEAHKKLYDQRNQLNAAELLKQMVAYAADIEKAYKAVEKAF